MRVDVVLEVVLQFEAEQSFNDADLVSLRETVREVLQNWAANSEDGLCPPDVDGYTESIDVPHSLVVHGAEWRG